MRTPLHTIQARINGNVIHFEFDDEGNLINKMGWGE